MKKILLLIVCWPLALAAQNGVTVSNLAINAGTITVDVSWKMPMPTPIWSDTVWVFVDYNAGGVMKRLPLLPGATLTVTSAPGVGKVMEEPENNNGVWVIGNARSAGQFSATVRLLASVSNAPGACVYASNYRPTGKYNSPTNISFMGAPMYNVVLKHTDGSIIATQSNSPYLVPASYTMMSFTDATGAPGVFGCKMPVPQTLIASASGFCAGAEGVVFALDGTQNGTQYQLYKDGAATGTALTGMGSAATFTGKFDAAGTYIARVIEDGVYCGALMNGTQEITANALPVISTHPQSQIFCEPTLTVTLTVTATQGSGNTLTYQWKEGAGVDVGTNSDVYTGTVSKLLDYWVVVTDNNNCAAISDKATITVASYMGGQIGTGTVCDDGPGRIGR
jgi:hypothetical protein